MKEREGGLLDEQRKHRSLFEIWLQKYNSFKYLECIISYVNFSIEINVIFRLKVKMGI